MPTPRDNEEDPYRAVLERIANEVERLRRSLDKLGHDLLKDFSRRR